MVELRWPGSLILAGESLETLQAAVLSYVANVNGVATNFAVFYIRLTVHTEIQHHGNFFPAIGTGEKILFEHRNRLPFDSSGNTDLLLGIIY